MPRPNRSRPPPIAGASRCVGLRRAAADGDTFHVVATGHPLVPRAVLSDRELFARDDLTPEDIEASADPLLLGFGAGHGE